MANLKVIQSDITKLAVDAIINAANSSLLGGGGADGAIHRAAGSGLLDECKTLGGCQTGFAKITCGYLLPAKFVIHTVGPIWKGGGSGEADLLADCYRTSLELAVTHGVKTLAFPSISTGVYGYPIREAAKVAVASVKTFLQSDKTVEEVILCCFSDRDFEIYREMI